MLAGPMALAPWPGGGRLAMADRAGLVRAKENESRHAEPGTVFGLRPE
jgi:hypothetical protein